MEKKPSKSATAPSPRVPDHAPSSVASTRPLIVGIGASAGGLEAFRSFFGSSEADSGMAYVLVQHLSPDHKSMLADLLGKSTSMQVIEAVDGMQVGPNCVFVIPPDATMTIANGHLKVEKPAPPRHTRRPIDTFMQSLAADQGQYAICIILSGTGSDGTLGSAAIRENGGLTLAQAEYDSHALPGMPQNAAASGQVDEVLAVEAMPARLLAYQKHLTAVRSGKTDETTSSDDAQNVVTIFGALRARTGHDFLNYKEKTLLRRLHRRMQLLQIETTQGYLQRVRDQPEELDELFRELLIGVTQFFRDPAAFEALNETVLKGLVANKGADETVRIWVPGCATGHEAYTLAILLREAMGSKRPKPRIQIFGTDIDDRAIAIARQGRYQTPIAGLSPERLDRWFKLQGNDAIIAPEIREMCVFSAHSIIKDPPFSKLDLISCRNLLIYIDPLMQDRVMRSFHYALKPGGRLFLGSSESVTRTAKLFGAVDKKYRIFERRETDGIVLPDLLMRTNAGDGKPVQGSATAGFGDQIDKNARRAMEKYYPPHLVVDRNQQIVSFSGGAMGQFLEPSAGTPSFALFNILRKPLRAAVRAVLLEVATTKAPVRRGDLPLRHEGLPHMITLIAEPLGDDGEYIVLAFQDSGSAPQATTKSQKTRDASDSMQALEQELRTTRAQLTSTINEWEVTNEEMKSSNEEYQSVNEELQSSNEELETSKEEMQSINEELQTINVEMISKNEMLTHLNSDIKNLLESTDVATLFLDEHLRINNFTRGIADIFSVRETDIGRPITEIVSLLDYSALAADVKSVLRTLVPTQRPVTLKDATMSFEMRIRPYRTVDNVITGVVCTFVDVTLRDKIEAAIRVREEQFHALAESIPQLAWIMDATGEIFWFNQRWFDYTNTTLDQMKDQGWRSVHDPLEVDRVVKHLKHCVTSGEIWEDTFPLRGADGTYRWFLSRAQPIRDESGNIVRWFGTNTDIEEQRRSEEIRNLLMQELDHRVKNLFAIINGMVSLSARSATTTAELSTAIRGRISALARAHALIRVNKSGAEALRETTLEDLARAIVEPYTDAVATTHGSRILIAGPEVTLGNEAITAMALVLHELATNAVKYGAFSTASGTLHISWGIKKGKLSLEWQERGGPPVKGSPKTKGFGSQLARHSIEGQLHGDLAFNWDTEGLTAKLSVSMERLAV
jgi:two-component system, chemotaxis family, CheB/CheR fusion protein